jgi:hypothetical protein
MKTTDSHDDDTYEIENQNTASSLPEEDTTEIDPRARVAMLIAGLVERGLLPILDESCQRGHVTREEVLGKSRARHIVKARQELWWCLRQHANSFSLHEIGKMFMRHHTSVLAGVRAHEAKLERMQRRQNLLNGIHQHHPHTPSVATGFDLEVLEATPPSVH